MVAIEDRYGTMRNVAISVMGDYPEASECLDKRNIYPFPTMRAIMAYSLHKEGFSFSAIGRVMNRNHSTISIASQKLGEIISANLSCNKDTIRMYNDFQAEICQSSGLEDMQIVTTKVGNIKRAIKEACGESEASDSLIEKILSNLKQI